MSWSEEMQVLGQSKLGLRRKLTIICVNRYERLNMFAELKSRRVDVIVILKVFDYVSLCFHVTVMSRWASCYITQNCPLHV